MSLLWCWGHSWIGRGPGEGFPGPALPSAKIPVPGKKPPAVGHLSDLSP